MCGIFGLNSAGKVSFVLLLKQGAEDNFELKRDRETEVENEHSEALHNLYSSPHIIGVNKSRRMRWVGHVAHLGDGKCLLNSDWKV
jgi:hypothetical protein